MTKCPIQSWTTDGDIGFDERHATSLNIEERAWWAGGENIK